MLEAMQRDKEKWIPKSGYNVVGVDEMEVPGEQLFLVGTYVTREEANRALEAFQKRNPGHTAHVYSSEDG